MSGLFLYCGSTDKLKYFVNVLFLPGPVAMISSSANRSAIISFTLSSIIGIKAANDDAADARVIADETEAPDGNAPVAGGGGGGGGGGGFPAAGVGFTGVIAGVGAAVTNVDGGIDGATDGAYEATDGAYEGAEGNGIGKY